MRTARLARGLSAEFASALGFSLTSCTVVMAVCAIGHPLIFFIAEGYWFKLSDSALLAIAVPTFLVTWLGWLMRRWAIRTRHRAAGVATALGIVGSLSNRVMLDGVVTSDVYTPRFIELVEEQLSYLATALFDAECQSRIFAAMAEDVTRFPSQIWLSILVVALVALSVSAAQPALLRLASHRSKSISTHARSRPGPL